MPNKLILLFLSSLPCGKRNSKVSDRGFTLIEVIVAMVILSVFILASLSALVTGLSFKLKAKLNNEATLIINQDLEQFRYVVSQLGIETVSSIPTTPANGTGSISGTTLNLTLPIVDNGRDYLSSKTAGSTLTIGEETTAYTLTSVPASNATSIAATVDLSKINKRSTTLGSALAVGSVSSITVANSSYFQAGDRVVVGPISSGTAIFSFVVTSVNTTANTLYFDPLTTSQSYIAGTRVVALPRIGDVIPNTSLCTGTTMFDSLLTAAPNKTSQAVTFNGRTTYEITRTTTKLNSTAVATDPAVTRAQAQVVYSVKDPTVSTSDLATLTTEVIPNVAFTCP